MIEDSQAGDQLPEEAPLLNAVRYRPTSITELLYDGIVSYGGLISASWRVNNKDRNRFFILNLDTVMDEMRVDSSKTAAYFRAASEILKNQREWIVEYAQLEDLEVSHTQINGDKRYKAKLLTHAIATIVAMELLAAESRPNYNVYNHLRILPAVFFIDRLDKDRLLQIDEFFRTLSKEEKEKTFADVLAKARHLKAQEDTFEALCMLEVKQQFAPPGLLRQLAQGYTATRLICDGICAFINKHVPARLHVGPARASGDADVASQNLGKKNVAPSLIVPKTLTIPMGQ